METNDFAPTHTLRINGNAIPVQCAPANELDPDGSLICYTRADWDAFDGPEYRYDQETELVTRYGDIILGTWDLQPREEAVR